MYERTGMIGLLLIAAAAIGYWAWNRRDDRSLRYGDVTAVVAGLIALRLFQQHEVLPGLIALGGAGWWYWFRKRGIGKALGPNPAMTPEAARRLLDLPADASLADIKAAHRRLIARVHPDAGGSADLTRQVNAARDVLLDRRRPI